MTTCKMDGCYSLASPDTGYCWAHEQEYRLWALTTGSRPARIDERPKRWCLCEVCKCLGYWPEYDVWDWRTFHEVIDREMWIGPLEYERPSGYQHIIAAFDTEAEAYAALNR